MMRILRSFLLLASFVLAMPIFAALEPGVCAVDFGYMNEIDGVKTKRIYLKNTGNEGATIIRIRPTCGCTAADYFKDEIAPGDSAWVDVSYNPARRPGRFEKGIKVYTSDGEILRIPVKGVVMGSEQTVAADFPIDAGPVRLTEKTIMARRILWGDEKSVFINIYNLGDKPVSPAIKGDYPAIGTYIYPDPLPPGEVGSIGIYINTAKEQPGSVAYKLEFLPDKDNESIEPVEIEIFADIVK